MKRLEKKVLKEIPNRGSNRPTGAALLNLHGALNPYLLTVPSHSLSLPSLIAAACRDSYRAGKASSECYLFLSLSLKTGNVSFFALDYLKPYRLRSRYKLG